MVKFISSFSIEEGAGAHRGRRRRASKEAQARIEEGAAAHRGGSRRASKEAQARIGGGAGAHRGRRRRASGALETVTRVMGDSSEVGVRRV